MQYDNPKKMKYLSKKSDNYIYLKHLIKFSNNFLEHLTKKYLMQNNGNDAQKTAVIKLVNVWNEDRLYENFDTSNKSQTSYTKNKGKYIRMCLKNKHKHNERDFLNMLRHVFIHEMAHIICYSYGHTQEFNIKFKFLLKEAKNAGLHDPINYMNFNSNYCGIKVRYNPYFDKNLPDLK